MDLRGKKKFILHKISNRLVYHMTFTCHTESKIHSKFLKNCGNLGKTIKQILNNFPEIYVISVTWPRKLSGVDTHPTPYKEFLRTLKFCRK